jgi:hypothetical protein
MSLHFSLKFNGRRNKEGTNTEHGQNERLKYVTEVS